MEGKSSSGAADMMPSASYGFLDLQGSMQLHHPRNPLAQQTSSMMHSQIQDSFNLRAGNIQEPDQPITSLEYCKGERGKNSLSDDEEMNCAEEGIDGRSEVGKGKKGSPWQRVKWTDKMVMLLITAVSYIGEDTASDVTGGGRRKACLLQKKGKWKTVSKVMAERDYYVSPQQCEDKFNDLNKRYKRLNDILGRGTSCKVVENPALLDLMDLSEKCKEDVRKILSSKHLFYEQMCSYHNGNCLHLPHDPDLQRSLQLALRSKDDCEPHELRRHKVDDFDNEDQDAETDDHDDEMEEDRALYKDNAGTFSFPGAYAKKIKQGEDYEEGFGNAVNFLDCTKRSDLYPQNDCTNVDQGFPESNKADWSQEQWMLCRPLQLEEKKLQIQAQMLELEKQRFLWLRFSRKHDRELDKMRLENECLKLENERIELELKQMEMNATYG
ncbi:uncharacterized protein LOC131164684 [Malania oleifera]|uniref:uncharacterized protein LOC131164684 n=1 Tax=Malania oleifera TaxID=397392 RepID=UPI0025AE4A91|nr:uncharacterized protein LOC131164684 [Malania oleifera]